MGAQKIGALNELALEHLDVPVVLCATDGSVIRGNRRARAIWAGLAGRQNAIDDLTLLDASGRVLQADHPLRLVLDGEEQVTENVRTAPDGTAWRAVATALPDSGGQVQGALLTLHQLSDGHGRVEEYASDIQILGEISRTLSEVEDADEAAAIIGTVTLGSTGAAAVLIWQTEEDGSVSLSHSESVLDPDAMRATVDGARTGARIAAVEMTTQIVQSPTEELTLWHEPLAYGGVRRGVLSVIWGGSFDEGAQLKALTERLETLIGLIGQQAANALERVKLLRALSDAARLDPLTGLANRREWSEGMEREMQRARRSGEPLSLLLIDIDHFKRYNDSHGHPAGDRLLVDAATAWAAQLREVDLLARLGGEEFAVILPSCDVNGAVQVAERMRVAMPDGQHCSLGVSCWNGQSGIDELYADTDLALYQAKQGGRNRVEVSAASRAA